MECRIQGLGFEVWGFGLELRVQKSEFTVQGSDSGLGFAELWGVGFRIGGLGCGVWGLRLTRRRDVTPRQERVSRGRGEVVLLGDRASEVARRVVKRPE